MERWEINRLADGIIDNPKRVRKIEKCKTYHERMDLAMRYVVAIAKDAKLKLENDDMYKVASVAVNSIAATVRIG